MAAAAALLVIAPPAQKQAEASVFDVIVCHVPDGDMSKARNITVSIAALPAHFAHGDPFGTCPAE